MDGRMNLTVQVLYNYTYKGIVYFTIKCYHPYAVTQLLLFRYHSNGASPRASLQLEPCWMLLISGLDGWNRGMTFALSSSISVKHLTVGQETMMWYFDCADD